jgi:RsiW-degrading membrane proteinase PrsW (M82 family)
MHARRPDNVVFTTVVWSIAALASVPLALLLLLEGGGPVVLLAALLALLPVGPLLACYLWLDRYEPEPRSLLGAGLAWGALVATMAAIVVTTIPSIVMPLSEAADLTVVAPVVEEATKGLFLVILLLGRRHELDGILDGIVYAGMVGIGFAFTENILYLARAYNGTDGLGPGGVEGLTTTFVLRCLASPFAHPFFTAFTGIAVGIAISSRIRAVQVLAPLLGYALAVLTHAAWNGSSLVAGGVGFFVVYLIVMVPAFLVVAGFAVWVRSRERVLLHAALHDAAVRGLIPHDDVPHVVDLRARRAARRGARAAGGPQALAAMREYQRAAIELGYLHHRFLSGTAPGDFASRGQGFVARMQAARPRITFPQQHHVAPGGRPA